MSRDEHIIDGQDSATGAVNKVMTAVNESSQPLLVVSAAAAGSEETQESVVQQQDGPAPGLDPWTCQATPDTSPTSWNELSVGGKLQRVFIQWIGKLLALLSLLYLFICSLDFLGSSFRLLGGRAAGAAFSDSELLQNPVAGLMIGVLATVLVQSSSTSTSIVVTMVASGILKVQPAIPIIMGANIGTSVTNTIVSLAQSSNRDEFRRAFAGATVHDMFNWLTVFVLLPLEMATGYLFHLTSLIVHSFSLTSGISGANKDMLQTITKPFTELIVQLDKNVIEAIATGNEEYADRQLLKEWCAYRMDIVERNVTSLVNVTSDAVNATVTLLNITEERNVTVNIPTKPCMFLFHNRGLNDMAVGAILLIFSLVLLCGSLVLMVKILNSALRGSVLTTVKKTVNAELPGRAAYFTGYIVMLVGALMTMVVQSSSVFTSVLTPLVGVGVVSIERMYPLTLGSNIGTTTTGILAALAASSDQLIPAIQISLCHMFFNLSGILLFYPVPSMRIPIRLAKVMGDTTARYRWFAIFYVVMMFFVAPMAVFALSMAGTVTLMTVVSILLFTASCVITINVLQNRRQKWLPKFLRDWDFLPLWMHSLEPADHIIQLLVGKMCCCCHCCHHVLAPVDSKETEMTSLPSNHSSSESSSDSITKIPMDQDDDTTSQRILEETEFMVSKPRAEDTESGYWSVAPSRMPSYIQLTQLVAGIDGLQSAGGTPAPSVAGTPAPSRLPSFAQLSQILGADNFEPSWLQSTANTPAPSRLPSFARFEVIVEMNGVDGEEETAANHQHTETHR